jgi:hypothetical protein
MSIKEKFYDEIKGRMVVSELDHLCHSGCLYISDKKFDGEDDIICNLFKVDLYHTSSETLRCDKCLEFFGDI